MVQYLCQTCNIVVFAPLRHIWIKNAIFCWYTLWYQIPINLMPVCFYSFPYLKALIPHLSQCSLLFSLELGQHESCLWTCFLVNDRASLPLPASILLRVRCTSKYDLGFIYLFVLNHLLLSTLLKRLSCFLGHQVYLWSKSSICQIA